MKIPLSSIRSRFSKRELLIIGAMLVVLAGAGGAFVWWQFFTNQDVPLFSDQPIFRPPSVDLTIFEHPGFLELGQPREAIVPSSERGRENPFQQP